MIRDDDDNGFGATVRYAPVVTEARYRKNALNDYFFCLLFLGLLILYPAFLGIPPISTRRLFWETPPSRANRRHRTSAQGQILRNREICR